jgi:hypothetical protein
MSAQKAVESRDRSHTTGVMSERKPWKKKTPVEVVLEQAVKLKSEIAEMEVELQTKKKQLQKFEEARKIFESA